MLLYTLDVCNKLEAEYWAEWGTILGVLRHKGVIPWDWDFDLSFRTTDFQKLLALDKDESHPLYAWGWYKDPPGIGYKGYESLAYSIYHKKSLKVGDIMEYRDPREGEVANEYVCAEEEWKYPNRKHDDVYPLKRVHILGHSILMPANPKAFLEWYEDKNLNFEYSTTKVENYDPVPFLLSHMHNPHLELHCKAPVRDAKELQVEPGQWDTSSLAHPTVHRGAIVQGLDLN